MVIDHWDLYRALSRPKPVKWHRKVLRLSGIRVSLRGIADAVGRVAWPCALA